MKKSDRKAAAKKKKRGAGEAASAGAGAPKKKPMSRREMLSQFGGWGLLAAGLGGGGYWLYGSVAANALEHDLTRVGQGVPIVVQIHDPTCPLCQQLQTQARRAVESFDEGQLQFAVANMQTPEGRRFATGHGVGHVTLLVFDGRGRRVDTLVGVRDADQLRAAFRARFPRLRADS